MPGQELKLLCRLRQTVPSLRGCSCSNNNDNNNDNFSVLPLKRGKGHLFRPIRSALMEMVERLFEYLCMYIAEVSMYESQVRMKRPKTRGFIQLFH